MPRPVMTSPHKKKRNDMLQTTSPSLSSQRQLHSIVGDAHFDTSFGGHGTKFCGQFTLVAGDNLRAAMRNDGSRNAFFFAPRQLSAKGRMADECFAASSDKRTRHRGAVAD